MKYIKTKEDSTSCIMHPKLQPRCSHKKANVSVQADASAFSHSLLQVIFCNSPYGTQPKLLLFFHKPLIPV